MTNTKTTKTGIYEQIQEYRDLRNKLSKINEIERITGEKAKEEIRYCNELSETDRAHIEAMIKQADIRDKLEKRKSAILKLINNIKDQETRDALKFVLGGMEVDEAVRLATFGNTPERKAIVKTSVTHFLNQ